MTDIIPNYYRTENNKCKKGRLKGYINKKEEIINIQDAPVLV